MIHIRKMEAYENDPVTGSEPKTLFITITEDSAKSVTNFSECIRRALNCWPDAHPELKELGDMLMHGKILQNYYGQRTDIKEKKFQFPDPNDPRN